MEYSTLESWQEISVTGVIYEMGSLYDRFQQVPDPRETRGKRNSLVTLLVIIFLAKLCWQDSPGEIADWAHNHADELADLLGLAQNRMLHHNTIQRVYRDTLDEEVFDRLAQEYSQREQGNASEVLVMDGKTLCGTGVPGVQDHTQVLSLCATENQHVLAQTQVAATENEISTAPGCIKTCKPYLQHPSNSQNLALAKSAPISKPLLR